MDSTKVKPDTLFQIIKEVKGSAPISVETICCNPFLIIAVIFLTGIIGGTINYLTNLERPKDGESINKLYKDKSFYLQILLGICGAALVPLLLYLTSSKLFEKCDNCFFPYFIFAGYCLIGAIFSRATLKSLAKRLDLEELKNVKEKLESVEGKTNEAEKFIESKLDEEQREESADTTETVEAKTETIKEKMTDSSTSFTSGELDNYINEKANTEMRIVLEDLQESKYKDRSIQGISRKTKIHEDNVIIIIRAFVRAGIVQPVKWYGKTFYRLTVDGRKTKLIE